MTKSFPCWNIVHFTGLIKSGSGNNLKRKLSLHWKLQSQQNLRSLKPIFSTWFHDVNTLYFPLSRYSSPSLSPVMATPFFIFLKGSSSCQQAGGVSNHFAFFVASQNFINFKKHLSHQLGVFRRASFELKWDANLISEENKRSLECWPKLKFNREF